MEQMNYLKLLQNPGYDYYALMQSCIWDILLAGFFSLPLGFGLFGPEGTGRYQTFQLWFDSWYGRAYTGE
jgi:hypothetical protein